MITAINNTGSANVPAMPALPPEKREMQASAVSDAASQKALARTADAPSETVPSRPDLQEALKTLNEFTRVIAQDLQFSMDEESGRTIVKVIDTKTQEVLRQIPTVETLALARSLNKMQGLLIREKA